MQKIPVNRRRYNKLVANEMLEDFALRFTAKRARKWSAGWIANTALGIVSFLVLEALGGTITLNYGVINSLWAIAAVSGVVMFSGLPICYYAARFGVDIDLLSRGAGFGYIGSTITSLIYASFTFIFFALEAAIMSMALELLFGLPLFWGYILSAVIVIPLVVLGITNIGRFQMWTQPLWLAMQVIPLFYVFNHADTRFDAWLAYTGMSGHGGSFNWLLFGSASAVLLSVVAQIGEQVDFLRFLPEQKQCGRLKWWLAMFIGGPGWMLFGALKLTLGSFLAWIAISHGVDRAVAGDPAHMYLTAFSYVTDNPKLALLCAGLFVILSQLKINVANAYAGSIAWSNFFSRLTHSHPGRVVWMVFNVIIALLLMELGVYQLLEETLQIYSVLVLAWIGSIVADLVINKPLGLSPKGIEFKRSKLYDVNPVGLVSMLIASFIGLVAHLDWFGYPIKAFASYIAFGLPFLTAPLIAVLTKGRFYLVNAAHDIHQQHSSARPHPEQPYLEQPYLEQSHPEQLHLEQSHSEQLHRPAQPDPAHPPQHLHQTHNNHPCVVCEMTFEHEDMAMCPAYQGYICSLCCSLDVRCHDQCRPDATFASQIKRALRPYVPDNWVNGLSSSVSHFVIVMFLVSTAMAAILTLAYSQVPSLEARHMTAISAGLMKAFVLLLIPFGIISWLFVLARKSSRTAMLELQAHTMLLTQEIDAHQQTSQALEQARRSAETANNAKSRYIAGLSHELRTPLNVLLGYAQLLSRDPELDARKREYAQILKRNGKHLSDLLEGLLEISKIEAGRLELHRDVFSLKTMLKELVDIFTMQAVRKGLTFTTHFPQHLPEWIATDKQRLRQILLNLLNNAIKYTHTGQVRFHIVYRNQVAHFIVEDTGIGISDAHLDTIFNPFERVQTDETKLISGTGLGLTISHALAELMGGVIECQSEVGQGSTFALKLMLSPVEKQDMPLELLDAAVIGYHGSLQTILVVDDIADQRNLISNILTPLGFNVLHAESAETALRIASRHDINLFMLDIAMPVVNGWQLAIQLRQQAYRQPIIMLSANIHEFEKKHLLAHYHNDYLTKPVAIGQLLIKLSHLLPVHWIYAPSEDTSAHALADHQMPNDDLQDRDWQHHTDLPDKADLESLKMLAEIGFMSAFIDQLDQLAHRPSGNDQVGGMLTESTFIRTMRDAAKQCHFEKIVRDLDGLLNEHYHAE